MIVDDMVVVPYRGLILVRRGRKSIALMKASDARRLATELVAVADGPKVGAS